MRRFDSESLAVTAAVSLDIARGAPAFSFDAELGDC